MDDRARNPGNLLDEVEIEFDPREWCVESGLMNFAGFADPLHGWNQVIACTEREIIVQVLVTVDVDLRGELPIAGRFDEEVDVRGTHAMATHAVHQFFRTAARRTAVPAGHD